MISNELEALIPSIETTRKYWFIRTDDGQYFETFLNNNFVGIGWNEVRFSDLQNMTQDGNEIKEKIKHANGYLETTRGGKKRITEAYNKVLRFRDLSKGDVILIPSNSSSRIAFGIINDDCIYESTDYDCPHIKRRRVNWVKVCNAMELDPKFYTIKLSRHSISDIDKYAYLIDNITNNVYKKGEYCFYCFNVKTTNDINVKTLTDFITAITGICKDINDYFLLDENIDEIAITLNIQSPGKIVIKLRNGLSYLILAAILTGCSTGNVQTDREIDNFKSTINIERIRTLDQAKIKLDLESESIR